jgi:predicted acyltransferase (DUF342 family)
VEEHSRVKGSCRTVNGAIWAGDESRVRKLQTVNGRIETGENVEVEGDLETVNGSVRCGVGTRISGRIRTVNGGISLDNTLVEEDLVVNNGDILLRSESRVRGDIIVRRSRGSKRNRRMRIEIADESVVEGDIEVRDPRLRVVVILTGGGRVLGDIEDAEVRKE